MKTFPLVKLGPLTSLISSGSTPLGGSTRYLADGPVMFVRSQNVRMNCLDLSDVVYIDTALHEEMKRTHVRSGDVFINITGASIGRVAAFDRNSDKANVNQHVCIVRPRPELLDFRYLTTYLCTPRFQEVINRLQRGGTRQALTFDMIASFDIPLPPLPEQRRTAAILDKADTIRRKREEGIRLTEELLRSTFLEMFGDPATNPKGWPVRPFGVLVKNEDGRRKPVKEADRAERHGEYPYYGASGIIDFVDEYLFDDRTLLIAEDGANLLARATPIAFIAEGKYWVNNHAHVVSDNGHADLDYLRYSLNLRRIDDFVTGSAQPKLNQASLNRIPVQTPPLQLQRKYASIVGKTSTIRQQRQQGKEQADVLFTSLVQRAFRGEL
jgi:type I restriction enzyme S subunit